MKNGESDLTLTGYIDFLDPPKESTEPAIEALTAHGVVVKVLTGDNDLVTAEVCRQIGLTVDGVVLGTQIDTMDDRTLDEAVEQNTIFCHALTAQQGAHRAQPSRQRRRRWFHG